MSETSHTSVYLLRVSCQSIYSISLYSSIVFLSSGILSVQKRHQGLKIKRWDFRWSHKSLKTAVVLRPDWQNFLPCSFTAWIGPTSKKEGHCDIRARTVLLYVLICLTCMYCTCIYCILYILYMFPCFPVSHV